MSSIAPSNSLKARSCSQCSMGELCLPVGLNKEELERLEGIVHVGQALRDGDALFTVGQPFESLYAVRSGMFKTVAIDESGEEHILGFYLPGELVGLEGIYSGRYTCTAVALDTSSICRVEFDQLSGLAGDMRTLQQQMFRLMSKELCSNKNTMSELTAEQKLAQFLVELSDRYAQRGYSATQFALAMSRRDIASYLGMAAETVSRLLKRFQSSQWIAVERRQLEILDKECLIELSLAR
ncbi:transcriptional Regulator, Crp/Fnr family [gamma proteobacterium HTCC5015]|nr:transcriptional Regulator, Crp/Fnr family [gamma proteobacterium HTCC5015]